MLKVIELLFDALNIAAPIFPELLFFCTALREAIDGVGGIRIHRIDVRVVRMMGVETIGEQEVNRTRAINRLSSSGSGRRFRNVDDYGDRNNRTDKYGDCVSDGCSHGGWLMESVAVYGESRPMLSFSRKRENGGSCRGVQANDTGY